MSPINQQIVILGGGTAGRLTANIIAAEFDPYSIPSRLQQKLDEWRYRCPWHQDERRVDEMFPAASYQFVLYGLGFRSEVQPSVYRGASSRQQKAKELSEEVRRSSHQYRQHLPLHRRLLDQVNSQGFAKRTGA